MQIKQQTNGEIGELRTKVILLDHFYVSKRTPDIEGADYLVELRYDTIEQIREARERITVQGIVQAKFFEGNNEVKIAKEYVEDNEGIRTDFFALLHTDDLNENEIRYFFKAQDIKEHFRLRSDARSNKEYYVFRLTRTRQFEKFKNLPKSEINTIIEEGIRNTEELRNQQFIKKTEERFLNPKLNLVDDSNEELFKRIKNMHVIDKLYEALSVYKDFRTMIAWRLVDKISFKETHSTSTTYNQFTLNTNNKEIINFFDSIEIDSDITITNPSFFKGVKNAKKKACKIVEILNDNGIVWLEIPGKNQTLSIKKKTNEVCNCSKCKYILLNFSEVKSNLELDFDKSSDDWENMKNAYLYFLTGDYEKAKKAYISLNEKAEINKQNILSFLTKYNLRITSWRSWEHEYPDLPTELKKLHISDEKRRILESLSNNSLISDYSNSIDEIYLKIKDYKQRRIVNNTASLIDRIYAKIAEYHIFTEGNYLLENNSEKHQLMVEKVIESFVTSYSMKTEHTYHVNSINDFIVQLALHHCDPNKLLGYFQRNQVKEINYQSDTDYFNNCIENFFSKQNVDFLQSEIVYINNQTGNPDLRRKVGRLFENICILMTYLNTDIQVKGLLKSISYYIDVLDFGVNEISSLAHPLIMKPELFKNEEVIQLVSILIRKENFSEGYLITNCLFFFQEKGYVFNSANQSLVDTLVERSISNPKFGLLGVLPDLLSEGKLREMKERISKSLKTTFSPDLYHEAVINKCLTDPISLFDSYLEFIKHFIDKKPEKNILFNTPSPYTGVNWSLRRKLNNLIEILYVIDDDNLLALPLLNEVKKIHPYYEMLMNVDSFKRGDPFKVEWILENQSEIVLTRLSRNKQLTNALKGELDLRYNTEIGNIFMKYFA